MQPVQRFQAVHGADQLAAAAADMVRQPANHGRIDRQPLPGGAILNKETSARRPQRFQSDDQPARQTAGKAGRQFQLGRPNGRGEDQWNLACESTIQELNHRFHGAEGQTMQILDGDQVGLAGGGEVGDRLGGVAVEIPGREEDRRQTGHALGHASRQPGDEVRLADAGRPVQEQRIDAEASRGVDSLGAAANAVGDALDGGQSGAVFRQRHPRGQGQHAR